MNTPAHPLPPSPALVTGATSGLGRATATRLARAGADVAVVGRSEADLASLARDLSGHEITVLPLVADLIGWLATSPGRPVLNEVTLTPLREAGWP